MRSWRTIPEFYSTARYFPHLFHLPAGLTGKVRAGNKISGKPLSVARICNLSVQTVPLFASLEET